MALDASVYTDDSCDQRVLSHFIGNIAHVAWLRSELKASSLPLPVILGKVLYDGTHCCDELALDDVRLLENEVKAVSAHQGFDQETGKAVQQFCERMVELAECALRLGRPIVF